MASSTVPIDRGYAWVIATAAFFNLFILIGINKCFGILFAEIVELYEDSSVLAVSSMLGISAGLSLFLAPAVSTISDRYSCRFVAMGGGIICSLGFLVPAYCTSLTQIVMAFGVLTGVGYGMCLTPSAIIVGRYFEHRRTLANGLVFTGSSGLGGIAAPLVLNLLFTTIDLSGVFMIVAGLIVQTVVFSALYRPLEFWKPMEKPIANQQEVRIRLPSEEPPDPPSISDTNRRRPLHSSGILYQSDRDSRQLRPHASVSRLAERTLSVPSWTPMNARRRESSTATVYFSTMNMANWLPVDEEPDPFVQPAVKQIPVSPKPKTRFGRAMDLICRLRASDGSDIPLLDLTLLRNTRFVLFLLACTFVLTSAYIGMIVPSRCRELGMSKTEAAILLSVQGGSDMVGRLLAVFLGDLEPMKSSRNTLMFVSCLISAVSTGVSVIVVDFWSFMAYLVVCSLALGYFVQMIPVMLVDIVGGPENLSRSWGLTVFAEGFAATLTPLMIGGLRDWTRTYASGLVFIDVCLALATILMRCHS